MQLIQYTRAVNKVKGNLVQKIAEERSRMRKQDMEAASRAVTDVQSAKRKQRRECIEPNKKCWLVHLGGKNVEGRKNEGGRKEKGKFK